jgi:tetratricopeptide (TPR) repeat protein
MTLVDDLAASVANGRAVVLVGSGVSVAVSEGARCASWRGLIDDGVSRCVELDPTIGAGWSAAMQELLMSDDPEDLILAAEGVTQKLGGRKSGEYRRWLAESVGRLDIQDPRVLDALIELEVPLVTTNYDDLLERRSGLPAVTWRDGAASILPVLRGDDRAILHLHGYWKDAESVVLGVRSYEAIGGDALAQTVMRTLSVMNSWVFVGFGTGLDDPNFAQLRAWMSDVLADAPYRHFRLALEDEQRELQKRHTKSERIFVVPYGTEREDLVPFLRSLRGRPAADARRGPESTGSAGPSQPTPEATPPPAAQEQPGHVPPRPFLVGREVLLSELQEGLLREPTATVAVLGPPGIGKSTLCLAVMHDPQIADRFGTRRFFVRCDSASSEPELLAVLADEIGVPRGRNLRERVILALTAGRSLLVLDNLETPWERDTLAVEQLLGEIAQLETIALACTLRGRERPLGLMWTSPVIEVPPLAGPEARALFLAIAGEARFAADEDLARLLADVDHIPLAIELLAFQAQSQPNLDLVRRRLHRERARMLERGDGLDRRLSVPASIELSISGPRMIDDARRVLTICALLPNGIAHDELDHLLPGVGERGAARLRAVGLAFDEHDRVRLLKPVRDHVIETHPPSTVDLRRSLTHYLAVTQAFGRLLGLASGATAVRRLAKETDNIEAMIDVGLAADDRGPALLAAVEYARFVRISGLGTVSLVERAADAAADFGDPWLYGSCLLELGETYMLRGGHTAARDPLLRAREVLCEVGPAFEANAVRALGDLARAEGSAEAEDLYTEALSLYTRAKSDEGQAIARYALAEVTRARGDRDAARQLFSEALARFRRLTSPFGEGNALQSLAQIALEDGDLSEAERLINEALDVHRHSGNLLGLAVACQLAGRVVVRRGDHDRAREWFTISALLAHQVGNPYEEANALHELSAVVRRHDGDAAAQLVEAARELYARATNADRVRAMHIELAGIAADAGDLQAAEQYLDAAEAIGTPANDAERQPLIAHQRGLIALNAGELDRAKALLEEAAERYRTSHEVSGEAAALSGLAQALLAMGTSDAAHDTAELSLRLFRSAEDRDGVANAQYVLGRALFALRAYEDAADHFGEAASLYEDVGDRFNEARARRERGGALCMCARFGDALRELEAALTHFRNIDDELGVAKTLQELARARLGRGEFDQAQDLYEKAIASYESLGRFDLSAYGHFDLLHLPLSDEERQLHEDGLRNAWEMTGRHDLVAELDQQPVRFTER